MSSYEKFDPSVIKKRIKDGEYDSLTGANRAIGKTQNLSEEDRDALKKFAAKHFGVEAPVAKKKASASAKKVAKKVVAKAEAKPKAAPKAAVAKKTAKRAAKKVSKKAAPKAAADSEAATKPSSGVAPAISPKPVSGKGRTAKAASEKQLSLPFREKPEVVVSMMGAVIGSVTTMLDSMKMAAALYPKAMLAESVPTAVRTMTRAVAVLEQHVVSPLDRSGTEYTAAKDASAKPKASKPTAKPAPKKRTPAATASASDDAEEAPESEQKPALSEEEQEEFSQLEGLVAAGADED